MVMTTAEVLNTVFSGITAFALVIGVIQLLFHSRQMHRDFEMLYVQRYWAVMDNRSDRFILKGKPTADDATVIHSYFQLCEDEIDLRRIGRVSDNTWGFWSTAITEQCNAPGYIEAFNDLTTSKWPLLQQHLANGDPGDPLKHGWLWRKWHGL